MRCTLYELEKIKHTHETEKGRLKKKSIQEMTTEEEKVKVKNRLKIHFKKAIDIEKKSENKSRNLTAVFDISLDY